jgi:hypothetical protein
MAYEELAEWYERQGLDQLRDRFLVLAADTALSAGNGEEAERIRGHLLKRNPHHLLKPFASLAEALKTADVQNYVSGLRRGYPPESVDSLLEALRSGKPVTGTASPASKPSRSEADPEEVGTLKMPAPAPANRPAGKPAVKPAEPPAVYALKEEAGSPSAEAPKPRQVPPPRGPARTAAPAPASRPAPKPGRDPAPPRPGSPTQPKPIRSSAAPQGREPVTGYPLMPDAPARPGGREADEEDEEETRPGAFLPTALFVLLVLAGASLAVYTFARPFLPAGWLR